MSFKEKIFSAATRFKSIDIKIKEKYYQRIFLEEQNVKTEFTKRMV